MSGETGIGRGCWTERRRRGRWKWTGKRWRRRLRRERYLLGPARRMGSAPIGRKPGGNRIFVPKPRPIPASARLSPQTRPRSARNRRHKPPPQCRQATAAGEVCPILNPDDFTKSKRRRSGAEQISMIFCRPAQRERTRTCSQQGTDSCSRQGSNHPSRQFRAREEPRV
jgi:hypothetical protein